MNKVLHTVLIVIGILAVAGGLVFAGTLIGGQMAFGRSHPWDRRMRANNRYSYSHGPGMTGGGMMNRGYGPGMMGGYGNNANVTPLTTNQAYQAAQKYVASLKNPDLKIAEVMVFNTNAYVRVIEQSTSVGAFEFLVDPATLAVTPEPGPNMMWNLKYGMMSKGGMGGMMGYYNPGNSANVSTAMTVSSDQALQDAQAWLNGNMPGAKTASDADSFHGYYTIDILRGDKTVGMLSVNGFSGQVFLHTWHGTFIISQDY
jgi:hypothetical protein